MEFRKYKYYFKKPKSEIAKDIFEALLISGVILIAATSPYFIINLLKSHQRWKKYSKKKVYNTFFRLKTTGYIKIEKRNHQIYISLTEEGKKKAGILQIDSLKITKPQKWDGKWRIVAFDIPQLKKFYREALRGKLKELGFSPLQKSLWVHPFDCRAEIELLKDFFGLSGEEIRLIVAQNLGEDKHLKQIFKIN